MERFLQMIDPLKLERTSFEDRLARVKQRKREEAEQRLPAFKASEEPKAQAVGSQLAVVCLRLEGGGCRSRPRRKAPLPLPRQSRSAHHLTWRPLSRSW